MPKATTPVVSLISGALLFFASTTWAQITPSDAKSLIGKREIVCGQVASANFAVRTKGQPTFLNLDRAYPNQIFTVLIWGNNRVKGEIIYVTTANRFGRDQHTKSARIRPIKGFSAKLMQDRNPLLRDSS